jgi:hypothetical protein
MRDREKEIDVPSFYGNFLSNLLLVVSVERRTTCSMMSSMEYFYLNEPFSCCWNGMNLHIIVTQVIILSICDSLSLFFLSFERGFVSNRDYHCVSLVMRWQQFFRRWLSFSSHIAKRRRRIKNWDKIIPMELCAF